MGIPSKALDFANLRGPLETASESGNKRRVAMVLGCVQEPKKPWRLP